MKNEINQTKTEQGGFFLAKIITTLKTWLVSFLKRLWGIFVREAKAEVAERVTEQITERLSRDEEWQAAEELMSLYRAWLGYLLYRLDEGEVRAPVAEVSRALDELSCVTTREGEDYVIRIQRKGEEVSAHDLDADHGTAALE